MSTDYLPARWKAVVEYRSEHGIVDVAHFFDEIEDLHDLIERGPNWACIMRVTITLNSKLPGLEHLTLEQEAQL